MDNINMNHKSFPRPHSSALKKKAPGSPKTLTPIYQITRRHTPNIIFSAMRTSTVSHTILFVGYLIVTQSLNQSIIQSMRLTVSYESHYLVSQLGYATAQAVNRQLLATEAQIVSVGDKVAGDKLPSKQFRYSLSIIISSILRTDSIVIRWT
jgi:hypothetical protein